MCFGRTRQVLDITYPLPDAVIRDYLCRSRFDSKNTEPAIGVFWDTVSMLYLMNRADFAITSSLHIVHWQRSGANT
jgi:hypothetical protein